MKLIERKYLDVEKWDDLVKKSHGTTLFSLSVYLDVVAENWCVWTDENYSKGIALPYTIRLGIKQLYTPLFSRYMEWLGEKVNLVALLPVLQKHFSVAGFTIREPIFEIEHQTLIYQEAEEPIHTLAKRMLTKFHKSGIELKETYCDTEILRIIHEELKAKVAVFEGENGFLLNDLVIRLRKRNYLKTVGFYKDKKLVGGMFFMHFADRIIYLKGAADAEARNAGAMYACIHEQIQKANALGLVFDFGGSRVEGVRRFNVNLGGVDKIYYRYEWCKAPFWWRMAKKIKEGWKK